MALSVYAWAPASELAIVMRPKGFRARTQGFLASGQSGSHIVLYS
jgi:hypothetical protein